MAAPLDSGSFELIPAKDNGKGANCSPIGRSGHCCVADNANLYVFGGYNPREGPAFHITGGGPATFFNPSRQVMSELWVFNFATNLWHKSQAPGIPQAAASSCMKINKKKLIVYGGTVFPFGHLMSNTVYVCDISERPFSWTRVETKGTSDQYPPAAYGQSLILYNDCIYTFAGAVSFYLEPVADLHSLSLSTLEWRNVNATGDTPTGRYKQEIVTDSKNKRFLVLGGGHLSGAEPLDKIPCYEFEKNTWSLQSAQPDPTHNFPKARSSFGCCQRDNWAIICGGRHYTSMDVNLHNTALDDIWALSVDTLLWKRLNCRLPKPTYFHSVALTQAGALYSYGGIVDGEVRSSDIHRYQLFLPPLSELAWQHVLRLVPDIHKMGRDLLLELGIPVNFVDRIWI